MSNQFRKKPVVITAIQYKGNNGRELFDWSKGIVVQSPVLEPSENYKDGSYVQIKTLEGTMIGIIGDWVIKGVNGEYYPCKPDIFEKTYEPASQFTQPATDEGLLDALKEIKKRCYSSILTYRQSVNEIDDIAEQALQKYESSNKREFYETVKSIGKLEILGESSKGNEPVAEKYFNGELIVDHQQQMDNKYAREAIPPQSDPLSSEVEEWIKAEAEKFYNDQSGTDMRINTFTIAARAMHERDRKEIDEWKNTLMEHHNDLVHQLEAKEKELAEAKAHIQVLYKHDSRI